MAKTLPKSLQARLGNEDHYEACKLEAELERESLLNVVRFYYDDLLAMISGKPHNLTSYTSTRLATLGFKARSGFGIELTPTFYEYFEMVRRERQLEKIASRMSKATYRSKRDSEKWATT